MKKAALIVLVVATLSVLGSAQVLGWANLPAATFAQVLSDCPVMTSGYFVCPVVPVSGQPYIAMSVATYNAGAPFVVVSQGPQGIQGLQGNPGQNGQNGQPGAQGPPGVAAGCAVTYNNSCPKPTGVNQNGCVLTITAVTCK